MRPLPLRVPRISKVRLDVESAERVAPGAAVVEQVGQQAVLADVGLEAGGVDDEVGRACSNGRSFGPI